MVMGITDQQEKFCHEIVKGKTQFAAYQVAYPVSVKYNRSMTDHKASMLASLEKIKNRIEQLRAPLIRKTTYNALAAHEEAGQAFEAAMQDKQFGPAVAAVQLRAKLHGLITEKREVKITSFDNYEAQDKQVMIEALQAEFDRRKQERLANADVTDVEAKE